MVDIINDQTRTVNTTDTDTPETTARPARRVERVRHEIRLRDVEVVRVARLSPNFIAVTFAGDALADFVSASFDDHLKFVFSGADGEVLRRDYTPRHFDPLQRTLTLEFALHERGPASDWARQAVPGQRATLAGPRGSMIIPVDYDWHLLAGDAAAQPAIHRRLEELPAQARAFVVVQTDDTADRRSFASAAQVDIRWVATADQLVEGVRALELPAGEGFAWAAGEATTMARLRDVLNTEHGQPKEAMRVAAYWRQGTADFHEEPGRWGAASAAGRATEA